MSKQRILPALWFYNEIPVACGSFKIIDTSTSEVKRANIYAHLDVNAKLTSAQAMVTGLMW